MRHDQLPCELQVDVAALRLRDSILTSAETEGLTYQAYWLSTTLALGAFLKVSPQHCATSWLYFSVRSVLILHMYKQFAHRILATSASLTRIRFPRCGQLDCIDERHADSMCRWQVRSIGKRDCGNLFKLGDEMIQFGGLHALLAASVAEMLPVSLAGLLSEDAKRAARSAAAKRGTHEPAEAAVAKSFEGLMNSPWKACAPSVKKRLSLLLGTSASSSMLSCCKKAPYPHTQVADALLRHWSCLGLGACRGKPGIVLGMLHKSGCTRHCAGNAAQEWLHNCHAVSLDFMDPESCPMYICGRHQGLLGGLSNVLETLRGEGCPPPACRAVVYAALCYVDAELLNALMLRRDTCSISAVKVLQARRPCHPSPWNPRPCVPKP